MHPVSDIDLIEVDLSVPPVRQGHPIRSEPSIPCQDLTEKRPLKRVIFKISSENQLKEEKKTILFTEFGKNLSVIF